MGISQEKYLSISDFWPLSPVCPIGLSNCRAPCRWRVAVQHSKDDKLRNRRVTYCCKTCNGTFAIRNQHQQHHGWTTQKMELNEDLKSKVIQQNWQWRVSKIPLLQRSWQRKAPPFFFTTRSELHEKRVELSWNPFLNRREENRKHC